MKRIASLLICAVLLFSFAACGQENLLSSPAFQPESTAGNDTERLAARGESDETETQSDAQSVQELPPMVRVRWQAGEFSAMLQLPESGLTAFWEHAENLLVEVDRGEDASDADPFYDPLVSSPYYSGQEALLEDLLRFSGELPQTFYWINEDTVRAAWEIGTYLSVTCQDRAAHFDWQGRNDEDLEYYDLFLAMSPEAELPDYEGNYRYRFTPEGEWVPVEEHPGFELLQVASEPVVKEKKLIEQLME